MWFIIIFAEMRKQLEKLDGQRIKLTAVIDSSIIS